MDRELHSDGFADDLILALDAWGWPEPRGDDPLTDLEIAERFGPDQLPVFRLAEAKLDRRLRQAIDAGYDPEQIRDSLAKQFGPVMIEKTAGEDPMEAERTASFCACVIEATLAKLATMTTETVKVGDVFEKNGVRIRVETVFDGMSPTFVAAHHIRKDGHRDRRSRGWSGGLAGWTKLDA